MDGDGESKAGCDFHALTESGWICVLEFIESRGAHEGFKADGTGGGHGFQMVEGIRGQAAPEREVEAGFFLTEAALFLEGGTGDDGRAGVQRHVEKRGAATSSEGAGAGGEAFPVGAAGFVEMDMGVDPTGQDQGVADVDFLTGRPGNVGACRSDDAITDRKCAVAAADDEIVVAHGVVDLMAYSIG